MAQTDFGTIDPATKSGTALATDLNDWRDSVHSSHSGSSAPSYLVEGMQWYDTDTNILSTYNGTSWGEMFNFTSGVAMDGVVIGGTTPAAGTFTTGTITTADINGGNIDGTVIGGTTPAAGTFTTGTITTADINGGNIDGTVIGSTTAAAVTATQVDVENTTPTIYLNETDGTSTYQKIVATVASGAFVIGTREDDNTFVSNDYVMDRNATGAINHSFKIAGVEKLGVTGSSVTIQDELIAEVIDYAPNEDAAYMIAATTSHTGAATNIGTHGFQHRHKINGSGASRITVDTSISGVSTEVWSLTTVGDMTVAGDLTASNYEASSFGSETTPAYTFVGDTNTGMYRSSADRVSFTAGGVGIAEIRATGFSPIVDNSKDLGAASFRWDNVRAANGSIVTSDESAKQDIAELGEAERRVAVRVKDLIRTFRLRSSVERKGDDARTHFGVIAQDVVEAFAAEGLDAHEYGAICLDDLEDGTTRYGVRYSELLVFMIAAM